MLLKILLLTVLVGPDNPPSEIDQPFMVVAPVSVMLEKSLPVCTMLFPDNDPDDELYKVTAPPATGFEKPVTMLLLLQLFAAPASTAMIPLLKIKFTSADVLATRLVNVLPLILSVVAVLAA